MRTFVIRVQSEHPAADDIVREAADSLAGDLDYAGTFNGSVVALETTPDEESLYPDHQHLVRYELGQKTY